MTDAMITVTNLTMGWDDHVLQRDANFSVQRGDIFVILGGSGCGKSTLLRHLTGLNTPLSGEIRVKGVDPKEPSLEPPKFGVMFQSGALLGSYTVGENVGLPLSEWTDLPPEAVRTIVLAKLRLVGLGHTEAVLPSELSGGMKKRAAIARAMALEPDLIFLDEPSAGLDPITAAELDELSLRLGRVDASGGLGEQIAVRKGAHELSYRDDQRWTERPAQYVRRELERALFSERGLLRSYSGLTPTLEVELVELELLQTDEQAHARVRLTAQVRDERRGLCHDNFETQLPITAGSSGVDPRADMERSVAALSAALHQTVEQVAARAVQCLQSAGAVSTRNGSERRSKPENKASEDAAELANAEP